MGCSHLVGICSRSLRLICAVALVFWGACPKECDASQYLITSVNEDHLGESLKSFFSSHRLANCRRGPIEGFDEKKQKLKLSPWIVCGLRKGVTFEGQSLLDEVNPARPFGMLASFYNKRLIELNYTLAITSIGGLLPLLERQYGRPTHITLETNGEVSSVSWAGQGAQMEIAVVTIAPAVADQEFLRIGEGRPSHAVQIRIRSSNAPSLTEGTSSPEP